MLRHRSPHTWFLLALVPFAAACTDAAQGPLTPGATPEVRGLDLPALPSVPFLTTGFASEILPAPEPAAVTLEDEASYEVPSRPLQQIFDPATTVRIDNGYVAAFGHHRYIGNVGAIQTTVHAIHNDMDLGNYTADRQQYTPFLFDLGTRKGIWADAKIYTDHTCGLAVDGNSRHQAWWQFYQGRSAPLWGTARTYSQAQQLRQASCSNTGTSTGTTSSGGTICYVLITWDLETGEILSRQVLACEQAGTAI